MKKKYRLMIFFGIVLVSLLLGKIILDSLRIGEPIYFRYLVQHYLPTIADSSASTSTMQLIYVQDFKDQRQITEVNFVDHPELKVDVLGRNEKVHGVYKVINETLYMEWDLRKLNDEPEVADIKYIQVTYSDGSQNKVDIGRICIYGGTSDNKILEGIACIPLAHSEREQTYQVNDTLRMEGLTDVSKEFLGTTDIIQSYSLKVGEQDITDMECEIKKGQRVVFSMSLNGFDVAHLSNATCDYDYFQMVPQLIYYDESGKLYTQDIYNFPIWSWFENYRDVRAFIKKRTLSDEKQ